MTRRPMSDDEFEEYFDAGGDTTAYMVPGSARRPGRDDDPRKVNMSMPGWLVDDLDRTAKRLAVSRQAVVNMWLAERLEQERRSA